MNLDPIISEFDKTFRDPDFKFANGELNIDKFLSWYLGKLTEQHKAGEDSMKAKAIAVAEEIRSNYETDPETEATEIIKALNSLPYDQ